MEKLYNIMRQLKSQISRPNPRDPGWVGRMKKAVQIAKTLEKDPSVPADVKPIVQTLLYEIQAIPEVSGVKTVVQGNKWEELVPTLPPLGKNKR